jgi:hypothetical protein
VEGHVVERAMERVGESRGISEEVHASLREGVVSDELYNTPGLQRSGRRTSRNVMDMDGT